MLGCNPQTITNYVRYGLIDEVHREMKGRDGFYYDSDQLASLAPHLTEIAVLEGRIAGRKEELRQQERELEEARERTRKEFLRLAGGEEDVEQVPGAGGRGVRLRREADARLEGAVPGGRPSGFFESGGFRQHLQEARRLSLQGQYGRVGDRQADAEDKEHGGTPERSDARCGQGLRGQQASAAVLRADGGDAGREGRDFGFIPPERGGRTGAETVPAKEDADLVPVFLHPCRVRP